MPPAQHPVFVVIVKQAFRPLRRHLHKAVPHVQGAQDILPEKHVIDLP